MLEESLDTPPLICLDLSTRSNPIFFICSSGLGCGCTASRYMCVTFMLLLFSKSSERSSLCCSELVVEDTCWQFCRLTARLTVNPTNIHSQTDDAPGLPSFSQFSVSGRRLAQSACKVDVEGTEIDVFSSSVEEIHVTSPSTSTHVHILPEFLLIRQFH